MERPTQITGIPLQPPRRRAIVEITSCWRRSRSNWSRSTPPSTPGGRIEALRHALGANTRHGERRTNPDKARCVEIAAKEFPKLSNIAIGKLCGVDEKTVKAHRPVNSGISGVERRIGLDGKERPAHRESRSELQGGPLHPDDLSPSGPPIRPHETPSPAQARDTPPEPEPEAEVEMPTVDAIDQRIQ